MSAFQWLSLAGIPGLIVLIGGIIINRALKKQDDKRNATVTEYERKQEEIRRQNEQLEAQNRATMLGVQALLRDRLLQAFKHYKSQGYADYNDRDNVLNMYTQYEALGPNSVMDDYYEQFKELPIQL
ncbi:MAG: hypothetical protein IIZ93_13815 [Acidaminococcaceae bacterium]|nr:hypothetical protein [Acidaminococcaceae bacterium]